MSLHESLQKQLTLALTAPDPGLPSQRLVADASRLWQRVNRLLELKLLPPQIDYDALHLACYALQLPMRPAKASKLARTLRDRCEQAAELLLMLMENEADEALLDRATRLLHEVPQRAPVIDEARLLADALNLEDFGHIGLIMQAIVLAGQGDGVEQLSLAYEKREAYGYWEARLKDGFHFEAVRDIARERLSRLRRTAADLKAELDEDRPR